MENVRTHQNIDIVQITLGSYFGVIAKRQTYINLAYLLARSVCCLIDLLFLGITGSLVLVLIAIPMWIFTWLAFDPGSMDKLISIVIGGLLVIPTIILLGYPLAVFEQKLASWILKIQIPVTPFWSSAPNFQAGVAKYVFSRLAWKRVLFFLLRVPLGTVSFILVLIGLPLSVLLFTMPVVYLTGFHNLILWKLRVNSFGESMVIAVLALSFAPLILHASNLLSRFSGWLARRLLSD